MERFYGNDHSVELSNEQAERWLRTWRERALDEDAPGSAALVEWFDERLERRTTGFRAFRIVPPPEPIADEASLQLFAEIVAASAERFTSPDSTLFAHAERCERLAKLLDLLAFVNEARGEHPDALSPNVDEGDVVEVNLRRRWTRFLNMARRENFVFPDDPRYPDPAVLLDYLDGILELATEDGREDRREWPFPKILWEREILLEKLGRHDELVATMRRTAALEDESFKRQTENYIASLRA